MEGLGSSFQLPQEQGINNQSAKQRCSACTSLLNIQLHMAVHSRSSKNPRPVKPNILNNYPTF